MAQLMLSERLHEHARVILAAGLTAGADVGITVDTADEWLREALHGDPHREDPAVVEWKRAVGLPVKGG